jgi:hypothetical protein
MSVTILIVEKCGSVKELSLKTYNESELYKKAGFKTPEDFKCHSEWNVDDLDGKSYSISVYGKTTGRANQENKFEFPPPIDNTLFFGNCVVVNKRDDVVQSITADEWETVYEHLYGGFEEIGDEDSEDDEDEDEDDGLPRTKEGYVKDDFIVDDAEEEDDDEEEEEEEEVCVKKLKPKSKPKSKKEKAEKKPKKSASDKSLENVFNIKTEESSYLDCTSELSEEAYFE